MGFVIGGSPLIDRKASRPRGHGRGFSQAEPEALARYLALAGQPTFLPGLPSIVRSAASRPVDECSAFLIRGLRFAAGWHRRAFELTRQLATLRMQQFILSEVMVLARRAIG